MISVCSDANVAYQWFRDEGEDIAQVEASRRLTLLSAQRAISLWVLDLTRIELANAMLLGRARVPADRIARVLEALDQTCETVVPTAEDVRHAVHLADAHGLTVYDATYAAVARARGAELATLDEALLKAGLGRRPSEIVAMVEA